jgi:hypothetical protein
MFAFLLGGALIGGALGGISTYNQSQQQRRQLRQQQAMAREAYGYRLDHSARMHNLERSTSMENLGVARNRLADALKADVEGFNLGLEGQTLQSQAAQVSLGNSKGMALAQQGESGVKGSNALQRQIDFSENQFERQLDIQGRGNSLAMQGMTRQYSNTFNDIGREMEAWGKGGYRYEAKGLSDLYAEQMHGLEMKGYEQAIKDAKWTWGDMFTGIFGGAASGVNFGHSAWNLQNQA